MVFAATGKSVTVPFKKIISHVNLRYDDENVYRLSKLEMEVVQQEVDKLNTPRRAPDRERRQSRQRNQYEEDDGIVISEVVPSESEPGLRRSQRIRRVRSSLTT